MSRQPVVLYQALLKDLSSHLPSEVISQLQAGTPVDSWPDITPKEYACLSLGKAFYKKFVDVTEPEADARALSKFLSVNERCKTWRLDSLQTWEEEALGTVKRHLDNFFYSGPDCLIPNLSYLFEIGRCGPGSSIGSVGGDEYTKMYSSPLSVASEALYRAYRTSIQAHPDLLHAELFRYQEYGEPMLVEGNRLSFVPKQRDISRVICIEPTLNMYAQLGLGALLERRLRQYFGIDLATQPDKNRELAYQGSLNQRYGTIDLESASDSMSVKMLEYILPGEVFSYLDVLRSPTSMLPSGELVDLNMVSTMGNGFTFPLQTIIFASVVSAAYDMYSLERVRGTRSSPGNWGVFGDDIVVDVKVYRLVCRLLSLLGFVVNAGKSFFEGPFRESCGADYFSGQPVRGVYVKTLQTQQDRCVVLNRLHEWSAQTGVFLPRTTQYLFRTVQKRFVPIWANHDAGIKVPFWAISEMRRSKHLQSILYRSWEPRTKHINLLAFGDLARNRRIYNPFGLYLSFLRGHIRNMQLTSRQEEQLYVTKTRVAPCWDQPRTLLVTDTNWQRWNTAVWFTLSG